MEDKETLKPQHTDPQKPNPEQKPGNQPVQQKPQVPFGQPKNPQSDPQKQHQEEKKQA